MNVPTASREGDKRLHFCYPLIQRCILDSARNKIDDQNDNKHKSRDEMDQVENRRIGRQNETWRRFVKKKWKNSVGAVARYSKAAMTRNTGVQR